MSIFGHWKVVTVEKAIAESLCCGIVNYKQTTALPLRCFPSVPHPRMVLPSLRISSRAQMWECRHAESQLAAPATTQSAPWNMAFFTVYCFLSRPNLIWGSGGGGGATAAAAAGGLLYQTPLVIDLEKCMSFTWGECGTKAPLKMLAEFDESGRRAPWNTLLSVYEVAALISALWSRFALEYFSFRFRFWNIHIAHATFRWTWGKRYAVPELAVGFGGVCSLDFTPCSILHTLAAWPLEEGVIIPAATQLLRYFYLPWNFTSVLPLDPLGEYIRAMVY